MPSLLLLLLLLLLLTGAANAISLNDPCIDSKVCTCDGGATVNVTCDCGAPSVEISHRLTSLNILPFTLQRHAATLRSITLRRCPSVRLHQMALPSCPPDGVLVEGVGDVALYELAFHEMVDCGRLAFVDVNLTRVDAYAFHAIQRVRSVEFRDATIDAIEALAFVGMRDVGALSFVNCSVGALRSLAVSNATRIRRLSFVDCDIGELGDDAIVASHVGHFEMVNTTVGRWGRRAVALADVRRVSVVDNRVGALHVAAFDGLVDAANLTVTGNAFGGDEDAAEALASLHAAVNGTFVVRDNELECDARLCQLLSQQRDEDGDEAFLALTKCANGTRTLAEFLTLVDDDDDECPFGGVASGAGHLRPTPEASSSVTPRLVLGTVAVGAALALMQRFLC